MFTPLDQFDIIILLNLFFWERFNLSLTNSTIFSILAFLIVSLLLFNYNYKKEIIPKYYQVIIEQLYFFVKNLLLENVNTKGMRYFVYIFVIMVFILFCNFLGLIPYTFTVTSHLAVTFAVAFMSFFGLNLIGIFKHSWNFFSLFLPNGAPLLIAPFLIIIEIISYLARVFSLSIRLFANMMSGHTLLKILAGFGWNMLSMLSLGSVIFFIPTLIVFAVTGLESAIAFLQAYVFTILICLYLNDALDLH